MAPVGRAEDLVWMAVPSVAEQRPDESQSPASAVARDAPGPDSLGKLPAGQVRDTSARAFLGGWDVGGLWLVWTPIPDIRHLVCTNSLGTESPLSQLGKDGRPPEIRFPDTG